MSGWIDDFADVTEWATNEGARLATSLLWSQEAGAVGIGVWEGGVGVERELVLVTRGRCEAVGRSVGSPDFVCVEALAVCAVVVVLLDPLCCGSDCGFGCASNCLDALYGDCCCLVMW